MITIQILGSSSSGNCGLLRYNDSCFLIDVGFSAKRIKNFLQENNVDINNINGIFITHEHHDHTSGIKVLSKNKNLIFYANRNTAQAIETKYNLNAQWRVFETNKSFFINKLQINSFPVPHDAAEPVGFVFKGTTDVCVWATDIGHPENYISDILSNANTIVLESNHDEDMVKNHPTRPYYLKERILGPFGHLSNDSAFQLIKKTPTPNLTKVYLAHLSKDCNSTAIVKNLFEPLAIERKFELTIINPMI